jgi:hypothetical protein
VPGTTAGVRHIGLAAPFPLAFSPITQTARQALRPIFGCPGIDGVDDLLRTGRRSFCVVAEGLAAPLGLRHLWGVRAWLKQPLHRLQVRPPIGGTLVVSDEEFLLYPLDTGEDPSRPALKLTPKLFQPWTA